MLSILHSAHQRRLQAARLELGAALQQSFEGRFVLFTMDCGFDLGPFVAAGQCEARARPGEPRLDAWSRGEGLRLDRTLLTGWYQVVWCGEALEVVLASFLDEAGNSSEFGWVVAADQARAEAFYLAVTGWNTAAHGEVLVYEGSFNRSRAMHQAIQRSSFEDLILADGLKEALLTDLRQFLANRELYRRYRVPWKRGLLLVGPPGNGKTHTVRALAREAGLPCLYVKSLKGNRGSVEQHIGAVFERARQIAPCVVVLEDLDCLIDESSRSVFLNELDGFTTNEGLLIVATTNHAEKLDRSLLDRPSRFDRKFAFPLPARAERRAYLDRWVEGLEPPMRPSGETLDLLVEGTQGFTFAYLKELTLAAMMSFMEHLGDGAMDEVAPRVLEALRREVTQVEKTIGKLPGDRPISLRA